MGIKQPYENEVVDSQSAFPDRIFFSLCTGAHS